MRLCAWSWWPGWASLCKAGPRPLGRAAGRAGRGRRLGPTRPRSCHSQEGYSAPWPSAISCRYSGVCDFPTGMACSLAGSLRPTHGSGLSALLLLQVHTRVSSGRPEYPSPGPQSPHSGGVFTWPALGWGATTLEGQGVWDDFCHQSGSTDRGLVSGLGCGASDRCRRTFQAFESDQGEEKHDWDRSVPCGQSQNSS